MIHEFILFIHAEDLKSPRSVSTTVSIGITGFMIHPSRHGTHSLHVQLHHPHSANSNLARYLMASVDPSDCHAVHGSASHDGYDATSAYSELLLDIQCTCNQTHRVMYSHRKNNTSARVTVYGVTADDAVPPKVSVVPDAYNFLLYIEPPHNLEFDRAPGFDGLVGFRHAQNESEAAVWTPWCPQQRMWTAIRSWRYEPKVRNNIGIWTDNCNGYPAVWRTGVIDALLRSGLPVVSYGRCRRNSAKEFWGMRVGDGESLVNSSDGGPGLCRKHRLMLAVENNACDGWISQNLCNVVEMCGAIPIIKSVNGWPDYRKLYGQIPLLNASKPGWLDEARRVMTDDGYYHKLLTSWRHERASPFLNVQCQWHETLSRASRARRNESNPSVSWQQCACPAGNRAEFDEDSPDGSYSIKPERWIPQCRSPGTFIGTPAHI